MSVVKKPGCRILVPIMLILAGLAQLPAGAAEPKEIARQLADRLAQLDHASYSLRFDMNYASQGYEGTILADAYVTFDAANPLGTKFLFENETVVHAYNGAELFIFDKQADTIDVEIEVRQQRLPSRYFQCSLYALRHALPAMLTNEKILWSAPDSESERTHGIEVSLPRLTIDGDGGLSEIDRDVVIRYRIDIDQTTGLPTTITKTDPNGDFMRAGFSDLDVHPNPPAPEKWFYSSWAGTGTRDARQEEAPSLIAVGQAAPDWKLNGTEREFSGKPLLIEFWISHCGYCIQAVPEMNALHREISPDRLSIISINVHDSAESIRRFVEANQPEYPIYQNGRAVAEAFGVTGYPSVVLLDAKGSVAYSGGMDPAAIRTAISKLAPAKE